MSFIRHSAIGISVLAPIGAVSYLLGRYAMGITGFADALVIGVCATLGLVAAVGLCWAIGGMAVEIAEELGRRSKRAEITIDEEWEKLQKDRK